jgi:hypothetical protein
MAGVAVVHALGICDRIVGDYREFAGGIVVHDAPICEHAYRWTADGYQWSDRWLSLSIGFASLGAIDDLAGAGLLQPGA